MDNSNDTLYGVLSYISILVIASLVAGKSRFTKFHANQGLVLCIIEVIFGVVIGVLVKVPILGMIVGILSVLVELACVCMSLLGILNVLKGVEKELPVIGAIKLIKCE